MPHDACQRTDVAPWAVRLIFSLLGPSSQPERKELRASCRVGRARLVGHREPELLDAPSARSPLQSRSRPRWKRTTAARGKPPVSGPRRENACTGFAFVKRADGRGRARDRIVRSERRGGLELRAPPRAAAARLPERDAVEELRPGVGLRRCAGERGEVAAAGGSLAIAGGTPKSSTRYGRPGSVASGGGDPPP